MNGRKERERKKHRKWVLKTIQFSHQVTLIFRGPRNREQKIVKIDLWIDLWPVVLIVLCLKFCSRTTVLVFELILSLFDCSTSESFIVKSFPNYGCFSLLSLLETFFKFNFHYKTTNFSCFHFLGCSKFDYKQIEKKIFLNIIFIKFSKEKAFLSWFQSEIIEDGQSVFVEEGKERSIEKAQGCDSNRHLSVHYGVG